MKIYRIGATQLRDALKGQPEWLASEAFTWIRYQEDAGNEWTCAAAAARDALDALKGK